MRTIVALIGIVCIGLGAMVVSMSGIATMYGDVSEPSITADDRLNDTVPEGQNASQVGGSGQATTDGEFVAFIVGGLERLTKFAALVVLLPFELNRLGLAWYYAYPLGLGAQFLTSVGLALVAANRNWT